MKIQKIKFTTLFLAGLLLAASATAGEKVAAQPSVKAVSSSSGAEFDITYNWKVTEPPKGEWRVFVHFTDEKGEVKFQGDYDPGSATSAWQPGNVTEGPLTVGIPDGTTGTFDIRIGLYNDHTRAELPGPNDDQLRVLAGKIKVTADKVEFLTAAPVPAAETDNGKLAVQPSVKSVESVSATQFRIAYNWKVTRTPKADWTVFVHFTDKKGELKFCGDYKPAPGTSAWQPGDVPQSPRVVNVPAGTTGTFDVRVGMYQDRDRAEVQGPADEQRRIIVGQVKLADGKAEFVPAK